MDTVFLLALGVLIGGVLMAAAIHRSDFLRERADAVRTAEQIVAIHQRNKRNA